MSRIAERIAGGGVAKADRADVAGVNLGDIFALVRVHLEHPADSLALAASRIQQRGAAFQLARINPNEGERPHVLVVHYLERQRGERSVVTRPSLFSLLADLADHRRKIERR